VKPNFEIFANTTGIVTARRVNNGDFISPGSVLFDVADLSRVWIMFDAYESDLPYLSQGQKVSFTLQALPGTGFSGIVAFIDPVLDPVTRVAKVRVEMNNPGGKLKPEMFATGNVSANLNQYRNKLVIPRSAVLWTGKRSIVYVKQAGTDEPVFKIREIELGPILGNSYVVENGLMDGEEIVTQGAFSVDASAQLEGKPSMMNPKAAQSTEGTETDMPGVQKTGKPDNQGVASSAPELRKASFAVSGNCGMCKARIEKAARSVQGVSIAVWDVKTKKLNLEFDNQGTNPDAIQKVIANAGHDTGKYKADTKVYKSLPECCLYRK
jgi:membrane fusion protein, copper/silver efflux system